MTSAHEGTCRRAMRSRAHSCGRPVRGREHQVREAQRERQKLLVHDARRDERPPILVLRSFLSPVTMPAAETVRLFGTERPLNEDDSPAALRSHVLTLASELRKSGPVVAIGPARSGTAGSPRVDVLFLEPTDADWFAAFETVSLGSSAIIMLPGETRGVIQEISSLRNRGLLRKLIMRDLDREIEYAFEAEETMGRRPPAGDVE